MRALQCAEADPAISRSAWKSAIRASDGWDVVFVKLFTRDKKFVADVEMPPFKPAPDGVMWGERFFVLDAESGDTEPVLYTEGLLFYVMP